jgi:hypothetical protein
LATDLRHVCWTIFHYLEQDHTTCHDVPSTRNGPSWHLAYVPRASSHFLSLIEVHPLSHPEQVSPSSLKRKSLLRPASTYSGSPSFQSNTSTTTINTQTSGISEIKHITTGLDRLENKPLAAQRFVPSERKCEDLSKLALGAKLERALGRRMVGQDAEMRVKRTGGMGEKGTAERKPATAKVG